MAAARALGVATRTLRLRLEKMRLVAASTGVAPNEHLDNPLPEGQHLKGVTYWTDDEGNVVPRWIKTERDKTRVAVDAMREFVDEFQEYKPAKRKKGVKSKNKELLVAYPIGDHHWGQLSWGKECGEDYDLNIARDCLTNAVDYLVDSSPDADHALLVNLGDWTHTDNRSNMTPRSGHLLDADGRYAKIARAAAFGMAHSAERLLEKHRYVKIVNVPGNHDPDTASWISLFSEAYFRNEPRVEVEISPATYLFHQFGRNMICMTHGDKVKLQDMPQVMASIEPKMWGETSFRVAWTGHVHHSQTVISKEGRGAIAESFGVLGPSDAFAASMGLHSQREMHAITFRESGGIQSRVTYNVNLMS